MIRSIYIDTSVFGGRFDKKFDEDSILFFDNVISNKIKILTSDLLELEIYKAPAKIIDFYEGLRSELR